jgi:glycosyltransferase involved in cell wall biosynthesis
MARRLEREITTRASVVTVVGRYFDLLNPSGTPVVPIPNGIDESDLAGLSGVRKDYEVLTLSYVGTIYGGHDPFPVLDALARLGECGKVDLSRVRVRIVGNDWRSDPRWPIPVERLGYVDHDRALREMREASVLLHYRAPDSRAASGKLYEYLASARPVLCAARPDGVAAQIVRTAGAGPVAGPDDPEAIEAALLSLYDRWRSDGLPDRPHVREWVLEHYSRRKLTADLAAVLDRAAGYS